jgi:hypothetical protein
MTSAKLKSEVKRMQRQTFLQRTNHLMNGTRKQLNAEGQLWLAEGEYGKDARGVWMARPHGSHTGSLENHEVTEHEDGTITVSPSILIDDGRGEWHGYLERGVWRKC